MRISGMILALTVLSGCTLLPTQQSTSKNIGNGAEGSESLTLDASVCVLTAPPPSFHHNCDMGYWLHTWIAADNTPWNKRKQTLMTLGQSEEDRLLAYVLSLPTDTPYQDRLRAQLGIESLTPHLTDAAALILNVVASKPNKQLMELESAMSVLSKANTQRGKEIQRLRDELKAQQQKLEELLQIEATLMDKNRSN